MSESWGKELELWIENARKLLRRIKAFLAKAFEIASRNRSYGRSRARHRLLSAINAVAVPTLESSDLDGLLTRSLRESILAIDMHAGMIYLTDDDERLTMVCQQGLPEEALRETTAVPLGEDIIGSVLRTRTPLAFGDLSICQQRDAHKWTSYGYRSFMGAPITCDERVLGVIALLHKESRTFSKLDSDILKRIASVLGAAVDRLRDYEEMANALVSVRRISRATCETESFRNLDEALERLAHAVCDATLGLCSMITLMDGQGRVEHRAAFGHTRQTLLAASGMDRLSARVLKTGKPLMIPGPEEITMLLGGEALEAGCASAVCLPLASVDRPLGALWVNYESPRKFASWELDQLQQLADRLSATIENSRLRSALHEKVERYKAMQKYCERIGSCVELKDVLQALADSARELLGARIAAAYFSRGEIAEQAVSDALRGEEEKGEGIAAGEAAAANALRPTLESGDAARLKEFSDEAMRDGLPSTAVRTGKLLAAPILDERNQPAGMLVVGHRMGFADFTQDDSELLEALGKHGSTAIQTAIGYSRAQKSMEQYRGLLDDVGMAIVAINKDRIITRVNKKFEELSGFSKEEIEGKESLYDILPEAEREKDSAFWKGKAASSLCGGEREAILRRKDGDQKNVKLTVRAINDSGSMVLCLTEPPQGNRAESVGASVSETPALHQMALSALTACLYRSIAASTDRLNELLQGQWPEEARHSLDLLYERIQACRRTLDEFRVLAERRPVEKEAVNINELITNLVGEMGVKLRQDDVGVVLRLDADIGAVPADAERLRWALGRLIDDSRVAMRETDGARNLTVQTERRGSTARITISDTRPTAAPERLHSLFELPEPDGQNDVEPNLSLPACRAIIERHGWRMSAECSWQEGMTFAIELPLPGGTPYQNKTKPATADIESPPEADYEGAAIRKVLIVDREDVVIDFLDYYLRSEGHFVETTRDGRDARKRLKGNDYDLVFYALEMPGLSGRELLQWLETNKPDMAQRVILIGEKIPTPEALPFLTGPKKRWLEKPFDLTELRKVIAEVLGEPKE